MQKLNLYFKRKTAQLGRRAVNKILVDPVGFEPTTKGL